MRGSGNVEEEDVYSSGGVCESEFVSLRGLDTRRDVRGGWRLPLGDTRRLISGDHGKI